MCVKWAVIGAGPAGIAAVGRLIDHGVKPQDIVWIDPFFQVGDLGRKWSQVSSNTKVDLFIKFLHASPAFKFSDCPIDFDIHRFPPEATCMLEHVVYPLQWITNHLAESGIAVKNTVTALIQEESHWQ